MLNTRSKIGVTDIRKPAVDHVLLATVIAVLTSILAYGLIDAVNSQSVKLHETTITSANEIALITDNFSNITTI